MKMKGNTCTIVDGTLNLYSLYGSKHWISSEKLKMGLPHDPSISLLCIYPVET